MFKSRYGNVAQGPKEWQDIKTLNSTSIYEWDEGSSYVKRPPFFDDMTRISQKDLKKLKMQGH